MKPDELGVVGVQSPRAYMGGERRRRVGVFGGPLDSGNNGVSALGLSSVAGLVGADSSIDVTLFGYTDGSRRALLPVTGSGVDVGLVGCYSSRRIYRSGSLTRVRLAAALGFRSDPMVKQISGLDAILDISGGDSFADLYGAKRFSDIVAPKLLALQLGVPLILLPQTYGPYRSSASREAAAAILGSARQVWARDARSLNAVAEMLGAKFDPGRHRQGVDVAFGLPAREPEDADVRESVRALRSRHGILVGLNVSGLLYNDESGGSRFGLRHRYSELIHAIVSALLERKDLGIIVVPHVRSASVDCDAAVGGMIRAALPSRVQARVLTLPVLDAMECKHVIGTCDWFCGTRMHACIAAISQGVPAAAIAYSDKTAGVFETAGVGECVIDPRRAGIAESVSGTLAGLDTRAETRVRLREGSRAVQSTLRDQFASIVRAIG